ncbi:hypothetical protein MNBD_CHLOROFLEXI01-3132 [hydrothermal vent metagenome]|uniref:HTH luxR-type domain-containing protein n=1 Tax=hydrothermal vent metagenome TaxID=652676 RepID=A0A3B0WAB7_9ZZZZ
MATQNFNLTDRQLDVLGLVTEGKTNREIGLVLNISEKTVEKYLCQIFKELDVSSRVEAAVWAVRNCKAKNES